MYTHLYIKIVVHIANDPVQMAIPTFIPLDIRHNKFNKTSSIVSEVNNIIQEPIYIV